MALEKFKYPNLGIDIEVEILTALLKFFVHGEEEYFGQCVISTGELQEGFVKGLETRRMPNADRRKLNKAIRRVMRDIQYIEGAFQRKKKGENKRTKRVDLTKIQ